MSAFLYNPEQRIERQLKTMESKRTDKLSQSLQAAVSAPVSSKMEKTLKQEMKSTAVPGRADLDWTMSCVYSEHVFV